jgi:ribosomal protein L23
MTQPDLKSAIDSAFVAEIEKIFGVFVANLETQGEPQATREFTAGFQSSLRAHQIATEVAGKLAK